MNLKKKIKREDFNEEMLAPKSFSGAIIPFSKEWWKAYLDYCNCLRKFILKLEKKSKKCSRSFIYKQKLSDLIIMLFITGLKNKKSLFLFLNIICQKIGLYV